MSTLATQPRRWREVLGTARDGFHGNLPDRYGAEFWAGFDTRIPEALQPGVRVLDVGAGARPSISPSERPPGCEYTGFDISVEELQRAPEGSYDHMVGADIATRLPEFEGQFDLVLSWDVLEHVTSLDAVLENLRSYLRPGGRVVAHLAGRYALFAIVNRVVPHRIGTRIMERITSRTAADVFPANYHLCWASALDRMLSSWNQPQVEALWVTGVYFRFCRPLLGTVLVYEEWARTGGHRNLASHYFITAVR